MKLKFIIIANIFLYLSLLPSCSAPAAALACGSGSNVNIKHVCINKTIDSKGTVTVDITGDGNPDFGVQLEKDLINGTTINSIGYLPVVNVSLGSTGGLRFDYYAEKKKLYADSNYVPIRVYENFNVDSSIYNWLLRLTRNEPNVVTHTYGDLTPLGSTITYSAGLIDLGDFYIAFRYYDWEGQVGPSGWKNGWIKLNITKDRIILKELAFHKMPETKIKVGEK